MYSEAQKQKIASEALLKERAKYFASLRSADAQVLERGDNVTVMIPADRLFVGHTQQLDQNAYPVLNDVISLLRAYDKVDVKIQVFTDNQGDDTRNKALSQEQAHAVLDYLWGNDIHSRILVATGHGNCMPIDNNGLVRGRYANRRVEIHFQELIVS